MHKIWTERDVNVKIFSSRLFPLLLSTLMAQQNEFSQDQDKIEVLALQDLEEVNGGRNGLIKQSTLSWKCYNSQTSNNCGNGVKAAMQSI
jgi:hypothetical protein